MKLLRYLTAFLMVVLASPALAGEILVIESYHSTNRWDNGYIKALHKILARRHEIKFFEMNTKRLPMSIHPDRAEAAWQKYLEIKPDFVVLADDVAIDLLGKRFAKEKVPVVFLGANKNPRTHFKHGEYPPNFTGVLERPLIKKSVIELSKIMPQAKKMLVLFDSSDKSKFALDQKQCGKHRINGIKVDIHSVDGFYEWQNAVLRAKANGYDAIIVGYHSKVKDPQGGLVPEKDLLYWTNKKSKVPIFAFWDQHVGKDKAVGGLLVDGYEHGKVAARMLIQVSVGQNPLSVMCWKGRLAFSQSELQRWGIKLPDSLRNQVKLVD